MPRVIKPQKININIEEIQDSSLEQFPEVTPMQIDSVIEPIGLHEELPDVEEPPRRIDINEYVTNYFNKSEDIPDADTLIKKLNLLGILFNTDPKLYLKKDYWLLLCILYRSLLHLYEVDPYALITTEWLTPHSDTRIPSEKLVKDTIDSIIQEVDGSIYATNSRLNEEIGDRQSEITRVEGLISAINNLIPSEATDLNQLADKNFVHILIATNASNFRGDWANWTSVPSDPQYYPEDYTENKKPNNNDYLIIQNATDYDPSNTGIWRFVYKGDWDTLGKSGWEPQYMVELAFTQELLNAINSGITSTKVTTYDGYLPLILAAL